MRARSYGLLILGAAGIVPLALFGYVATQRSQRTAMAEVREGNQQLATTIAARISDYVRSETEQLITIGSAAIQAPTSRDAEGLVNAFELRQRHVRRMVIYRVDGTIVTGREPGDDAPTYQNLSRLALSGRSAHSNVRPASPDRAGGFAHTMVMAEPLEVAGKREGGIVATVDMVGIWPPINAVRVGRSGFARLLTRDGQLLAHGDPEERRSVFSKEGEGNRTLVEAALRTEVTTNQSGRQVIAAGAQVPGLPWVVVVEQDVEEAYAEATAMKRDLAMFAGAALLAVIILGVVFGRFLVRGLESLRAHTRVLARGDLAARADPRTSVEEIRVLAESLNEMASSLAQLQEEAAARERLSVFSRVAAGLAHDLRHPIEALRGACDMFLRDPDKEGARRVLTSVTERDLPRLERFVSDLRRLARDGDVEIAREPVEPLPLARSVIEDLSGAPKFRGVEFEVAGDASPILADGQLVRRALVNLVGNGADAVLAKGPGGSVTIEVEDAGDDAVSIRVRDTGVGIEESRLGDLFKADFRSTKRTTGVGLGLGVVRHVAEAHRGHVEVSSEVGVGSTFTLTLPRSKHQRAA
jgi:signal transduction histidine kinase